MEYYLCKKNKVSHKKGFLFRLSMHIKVLMFMIILIFLFIIFAFLELNLYIYIANVPAIYLVNILEFFFF